MGVLSCELCSLICALPFLRELCSLIGRGRPTLQKSAIFVGFLSCVLWVMGRTLLLDEIGLIRLIRQINIYEEVRCETIYCFSIFVFCVCCWCG